jgi:hypothetical protein
MIGTVTDFWGIFVSAFNIAASGRQPFDGTRAAGEAFVQKLKVSVVQAPVVVGHLGPDVATRSRLQEMLLQFDGRQDSGVGVDRRLAGDFACGVECHSEQMLTGVNIIREADTKTAKNGGRIDNSLRNKAHEISLFFKE